MAFNMDDYVDVAERIRLVKEAYPEAVFRPANPTEPFKIVEVAGLTYVAYTAALYRDPFDACPAIACAWEEIPGRTPYTKGSELMNAETSAWGRCAIAIGIPSKKIASAQEIGARAHAPLAPVIDIKKTEQELYDPWATTTVVGAETTIHADDQTCVHGQRIWTTGVKEETGRAWGGWKCNYTINGGQCNMIWYVLSSDGTWKPQVKK